MTDEELLKIAQSDLGEYGRVARLELDNRRLREENRRLVEAIRHGLTLTGSNYLAEQLEAIEGSK